MQIEKYSDRLKTLIQSAQTLALRGGHQQLTPLHVLKALLDDEQRLAANLIEAAGGSATQVGREVDLELAKLPKVEGAGAGQIYLAPLDASGKPDHLVVRGQNHSEQWSPDGSQLVFASTRGDHSFIGVYDAATKSVRFLAPSVDTDSNPVWSFDGKRIAFVRRPAQLRDTPSGYFLEPDKPHPWAIWIADAVSSSAHEIWHSGTADNDSYPYMAADTGGGVLHWAAGNRLLIASEQDGWQHLYSLSVDGGAPKLLTPGKCEVEQWSLTPDKKNVLFNSNCNDVDRRHLWSVGIGGDHLSQWTKLRSIEWSPVALPDGKTVAFLRSDATVPPAPVITTMADRGTVHGRLQALADDFPADSLVEPEQHSLWAEGFKYVFFGNNQRRVVTRIELRSISDLVVAFHSAAAPRMTKATRSFFEAHRDVVQ